MIRRNIIANFIGRAWGVLAVYLFIPFYLQFLGIEAYGLVGFYSTLLGVLVFADLGLTATLSREMARLSVKPEAAEEMRDLLRTYETVYGLISIALAAAIWVCAPVIATRWLQASELGTDEIVAALRIMGIAIALQLPSGLFMGGLTGLQKQVLGNALQIGWGAVRGVGAVLILWKVSPTITAFAFWQMASNALYCLAARSSLWAALPLSSKHAQFQFAIFRQTWRYAAGMIGITALSAILTQTDKLVVSKLLPLEMLGHYTLAGTLAHAPIILASPVAVAVFPRLTGAVSSGDEVALRILYHKACRLVAVLVIPATLALAACSGRFIFAWTGNAEAARQAGIVASFLLCGSLIQALMGVPHYLALAHAYTRLNIQMGLVSVALITPLLIALVSKYGIMGGGISWMVLNMLTMPAYMYFIHHRFLRGELRNWYARDVAPFLATALPCVAIAWWLMPETSSRTLTFMLVAAVWAAAAVPSVAASSELRRELAKRIGRLWRSRHAA